MLDLRLLTAVHVKIIVSWDAKPCSVAATLLAMHFAGLLFASEDGGNMFL
jgi:hypothetical protein